MWKTEKAMVDLFCAIGVSRRSDLVGLWEASGQLGLSKATSGRTALAAGPLD